MVERVRARGLFAHVEVGFMELNEPEIPEAIERCVEAGAQKVIAVPYFLHAGTHVADDLPGLLDLDGGDLVAGLGGRAIYPPIVAALRDVAREIGAQTIATQVQDARALELVRAIGLDHAQGFHLGRPQPLEECLARVSVT